MKTLILTALAIFTLGFSPLTARSFAQKIESEVSFTLEKGYIIIPAKIRSKEPVEVAIATGAASSLIAYPSVRKHKFQIYTTRLGINTRRGGDQTRRFVPVTDVRVGDVNVRTLDLEVGSQLIDQIRQAVGREIFGVLGADFFRGRTVQFDFRDKVIRFLSGWKPGAAGADPQRVATLQMQLYARTPMLPIVDVKIEGRNIKTLLDIGAITVVALTPKSARQTGFNVPPDKRGVITVPGSIEFEKIAFSEVPITVHGKGSPLDLRASGYSAIVGIAVLKNFISTFDYYGGHVVLERF